MLTAIALIIVGFVLLMIGAEYTVQGSVAIANKLKIPTIIIGLTIVALGTSAPELVVSIKSALNGVAGISLGNIIGSNIANVFLILGAAALIHPIKCRRRIFLRDYKFLFFVTTVFLLFALSGKFVLWQGVVLLLILLGFIYYNYRNTSKSTVCEGSVSPMAQNAWYVVLAVTTAGLFAIIYGADLLVKGAVDIAKILGVSDEIIGLTIIAVGTSLPELATTVMAAIRKENDVALGNILGSNIWNIVFIMGVTPVITEVSVPLQFIRYDIWVLLLSTILLLPVMMTRARIDRNEGGLFVVLYGFYLFSQIMIAQGAWIFE